MPASHAVAASFSVADFAPVMVPRRSATWASARHAFASARVLNVLRIVRFSRRLKTCALYVGVHVHFAPSALAHLRL